MTTIPSISKLPATGIIAVTAALLLASIALARKESSSRADVPLLTTSAWQGGMPEYGEQILLRREARQGGMLLLNQTRRKTVYRYDPVGRSLTAVSEQAWQRATGSIAECGKQTAPSPRALEIEAQSKKLLAGKREISTAGRTALALTVSPTGRWVAVLSAAGDPGPSMLPFFGGSGASGQHYHQILSLPDAMPVGEAVRLPLQRDSDILIPCWSTDERMVVYYHILFAYLSVVETDLPSTSKTLKVLK